MPMSVKDSGTVENISVRLSVMMVPVTPVRRSLNKVRGHGKGKGYVTRSGSDAVYSRRIEIQRTNRLFSVYPKF